MEKIIYHYSDKNIKQGNNLKTCFFGNNLYTSKDKNILNRKRLYFYDNKNNIEYHLRGKKYLYTCKIKNNFIYDITKDRLKLKKKYNHIKDIIKHITKLKYNGISYIIGNDIFITCLFKDIKILNKIEL